MPNPAPVYWTKSPFVAAFFAYATAHDESGFVSVFEFDHKGWSDIQGNFAPIRTPQPILRTLELPGGPTNPRVVPQQSVTMYSNMAEIEGFIRNVEKQPTLPLRIQTPRR